MYRGVFLNLARNEKRRATLTRHLEEIGAAARYERFEAVDGRAVAAQHPTRLDPGNLGLWLTHENLLRAVGDSAPAHLHILEDDAVLAKNAVNVLDGILAQIDATSAGWDLLFTDVFIKPRSDTFLPLLEKMQLFAKSQSYTVVDLARLTFACTTSLVINRLSLQKYASLIAGKWSQGLPIDLYIRELVHRGQLRAYLTVPFITSISPHSTASDIRGNMDRSRRVCDTFRRALFQDADLPALMGEMQKLTAGAKVMPLVGLYLNAEMFTLGDQFERY